MPGIDNVDNDVSTMAGGGSAHITRHGLPSPVNSRQHPVPPSSPYRRVAELVVCTLGDDEEGQ
ncbi:MAG TPA: hypothetical protein VGO16_15365 [Pseudonocardiaceae bacterium]|nr:hypothetical protein [Pseudonocardiaceae bacterium]